MNIITDNLGAWLGATIVAFLTIFSDVILERIRTRLNRANLRAKYFEELAIDLSTYLFYAEIFEERYRRGWTRDQADLVAVAGAINGAITTLRKKEYVYRSWATKYWGTTAAHQLVGVLNAVKSVDDAAHAFNDTGDQEKKLSILEDRLDEARTKVETWLSQTDA